MKILNELDKFVMKILNEVDKDDNELDQDHNLYAWLHFENERFNY